MAIAIDGSGPAIATQTNGATATVTTASFTPPAGSLLLIGWAGNSAPGVDPGSPSITDNLGAHLSYSLSDWSHLADSPTADGQAALWTAAVGTSSAMTVTVTNAASSGNRQAALKVWVLTGADTVVGAHGKSGSISAASIAQNYTAQATGGWGFIADDDWDVKGAQSAGTGCTSDGSADVGTAITYGFMRRTTADDVNGNSNTLNVTIPATSTGLRWAYIEIKPATSTIPWSPARLAQPRDYGEVPWIQKDRRNANLVATAANDLAVPLLVPEHQRQAYALSALLSRRLVPQQRAYFDPTLLTPAVALPTPPPQRTAQLRDPGEVQWQQGPRRDPQLLTTALLENELLGGADTGKRYLTPATHATRWWAPQQPQREGFSPGLLDSAQLEGPLLGAADDLARHRMWFTDRRETPPPRTYFDLTLLVTDPLGLGNGDELRRYLTPATNADRRLVPQQPLRQSFYFDAGPDVPPLSVAWGVGGHYWHLYNQAGLYARVWSPLLRRPLVFGDILVPADVLYASQAAQGLVPGDSDTTHHGGSTTVTQKPSATSARLYASEV